ncbi:MAG: outer membrane beta-barrel protein [Pseudomonadota bacterium]
MTAVPALAQDAPPQDTRDGSGYDRDSHFSGPYVSAFGGISIPQSGNGQSLVFDRGTDGTFGDTVVTSTGDNAFAPGFCGGSFTSSSPGNCETDKSRGEYGARIGYDYRMDYIVVGALVEGNKSDATDSTSAFSSTPAAYRIDRQLDYAISGRLRVGITPMGGALFYGTAGVSYARVDHIFTTTNGANSFTPNRDDDMVWGWQAGGGAEIMVTDNVSLGLEYLYSRYNDNKYSVNVSQGTAADTNPFVLGGGTTDIRMSDHRFDTYAGRVTLGFHF